MVRKYLFLASVAFGITTAAAQKEVASNYDQVRHIAPVLKASDFNKPRVAKFSDRPAASTPAKAPSTSVQWKRPAGQFWGTGYSPDINALGYSFTPLALRPWVEYTFENISKVTGTGTWTVQNFVIEDQATGAGSWVDSKSQEQSVTTSYLRYERANAPRLGYRGQVVYPTQFLGKEETNEPIQVNPDYEIRFNTDIADGVNMAVSSHYWGIFSRNETERSGMTHYVGLPGYEGMEDFDEDMPGGSWFGTNSIGLNAAATRFEKPDSPYLLNAVYWFYWFGQDIPKNIPLKAYVFKTVNDAKEVVGTTEAGEEVNFTTLEIGELIAESEAFVPAAVYNEENNWYNSVKFEFKEKNPVTGAENAYSLEIEDDITVVVTGFDADLGNGGWIASTVSLDEFNEGYGNLGFLGSFEKGEDGTISYQLNPLEYWFGDDLANSVSGILADVSYPWIVPYYDYPEQVKLPNEGETTQDEQGLQVDLRLVASSMTEDFEITYNGEEECDWFELVDLEDEMEFNDEGEEEFSGVVDFAFEAAPNPTDENRTVTVKFSIPAATYEITFLQGSNNNAVEIVGVDKNAEYFDLQGRRVANPEKGLYIKKSGNKSVKVIL